MSKCLDRVISLMPWDERESFSRRVGRLFIGVLAFGCLAVAAAGLATRRIELVWGAVGIVGAAAFAILFWLVATVPLILVLLGWLDLVAWVRRRKVDETT